MPFRLNFLEIIIVLMLAADLVSDLALWIHNLQLTQ